MVKYNRTPGDEEAKEQEAYSSIENSLKQIEVRMLTPEQKAERARRIAEIKQKIADGTYLDETGEAGTDAVADSVIRLDDDLSQKKG